MQYPVKNFDKGLIDAIEAHSIANGAYSGSLNFLTQGDRFELRRGQKFLGTDAGAGQVTGIGTAYKWDGTEMLFIKRGRKILYYTDATDSWTEVGTDLIPAVATNEDIAFAVYTTAVGSQLFFSSPNSGLWQILTANPANAIDLYDATKNGKGFIKIKNNRIWQWQRVASKSTYYLSYIDDYLASSTVVTAEAIGALGSKTYTGTLAFKAGGAKRSCYAITFTDTVETFTDNKDGTLTGSAGGTGTINYATGAYSITFNVVTANPVTSTYNWFDPTNKGIADFTYSATRASGEGTFFPQGEGGGQAQTVVTYGDTEYCLHEKRTWAVTLTQDDLNATNLLFRESVGIPNWRAAVDTGEGIFYIDDSEKTNPKVRILTYATGSTVVVPQEKSVQLDLTKYYFDKAAMIKWGDYILCACRETNSSQNNRVLVYNLKWNSWDILDYNISCFAVYNGALIGGDSISLNAIELFSGLDDFDQAISSSNETPEMILEIEGLKRNHKLWINGRIGVNQSCDVYQWLDNSGYSKIGSIDGTGNYVDKTQSIAVGAVTLGKKIVGGGSDGITAYNYWKEIKYSSDKFYRIKLKFVPTGVGWFDVSSYNFSDIRQKQEKLPRKYTV